MLYKIKKEIQKRMGLANGMIEIVMKKSGDVVIITATGSPGPETTFEMKGYKLQPIYAKGLDRLTAEIANYDQTVKKQQDTILGLYAFKREKIDTGTASPCEKSWYADKFESVFGYRPSEAA